MASNYYQYGTNLQDREFFTSTVNTSSGTTKRYFSNIEGEIYFGNKLIEDIYKFDFVVEEKKLPLYGYNCFYPTIIVPGQRIVQGTFAINFTNGDYMNNILSEIDDSIMCNSIIESEIYNPSDDNRDKAIWSKCFDITIGYGNYNNDNETYNATCQTICGAQIFNMQSAVDVTGEPIMEIYSFIAKDFISGNIDNTSTKKENTNKKTDDKTDKKTDKFIYADKNNKDEFTKKYTQYKNNKKAINILHDIKIALDKDSLPYYSVEITDFENNILKCSNVTLLVDEHLNYNFTVHNLEKVKEGKFTYSFKNNLHEGNLIVNCFTSKKYSKVSCTLKYQLSVNNKKYNIEYNGFIYNDKKTIK